MEGTLPTLRYYPSWLVGWTESRCLPSFDALGGGGRSHHVRRDVSVPRRWLGVLSNTESLRRGCCPKGPAWRSGARDESGGPEWEGPLPPRPVPRTPTSHTHHCENHCREPAVLSKGATTYVELLSSPRVGYSYPSRLTSTTVAYGLCAYEDGVTVVPTTDALGFPLSKEMVPGGVGRSKPERHVP